MISDMKTQGPARPWERTASAIYGDAPGLGNAYHNSLLAGIIACHYIAFDCL